MILKCFVVSMSRMEKLWLFNGLIIGIVIGMVIMGA